MHLFETVTLCNIPQAVQSRKLHMTDNSKTLVDRLVEPLS